MPTVLHRDPVAIRQPGTAFSVPVKRGDEFTDDDPIVAAYPWLFAEPPAFTGGIVESVKIPQRAAGKK